MKNAIDLQSLIDELDLNYDRLARILFPSNDHPKLSLARVIKGKSKLDENQIKDLSDFSGLSIEDLFSRNNWTAKHEKGLHVFRKGNYVAKLNTDTWLTKVYINGTVEHTFLIHQESIPLNEYIKLLETEIQKLKDNDYN